ncbi:MAG: cytochrome P450 family protein [Pseudonocardiaceae bacterium]
MSETATVASFASLSGPQRHLVCAELVASGPVHRVTLPDGTEAWLVASYDEARQALNDPRLNKGDMARTILSRGKLSPELYAAMALHMLNCDPPDHTRLRRLVSAAFTQHRIEQLAPRIQQITDQLLDQASGTGRIDLISEFAYPLSITVICELLGIPEHRRSDFRAWSSVIVSGTMVQSDEFVVVSTALAGYLRELVAAKRADPANDLLSALIAVRDGADSLSEDELTSMGFLLLLAGYETTANMIGNGAYDLLIHPEQLALLRARPDLLPAAVEEVLRFDGPSQVASFRQTSEPVRIGDVTIPANRIVIINLLAANRDPAHMPEPGVLDINRERDPHLAFSHGIHHCLGAPLARLEGRIALGTLLARFPRLRLAVPAEQLAWQPSMLINGLAELPVAVH